MSASTNCASNHEAHRPGCSASGVLRLAWGHGTEILDLLSFAGRRSCDEAWCRHILAEVRLLISPRRFSAADSAAEIELVETWLPSELVVMIATLRIVAALRGAGERHLM